jgi:ATP-dependent helicase/nuclease subunit A
MIPDQLQRETALDISRSFIVQAPAGSGKTELLTQRFIRLLSVVKHPEEIIAITFTRKAAIEMKHRILSKINKNESYHLRIMTIDAFNKFLSEQLPLESSLSENYTLSENPESLYIKSIEKLFSTNYTDQYTKNCLQIFLTYLDNDILRVKNLLIDLIRYRDQWLPHLPQLAHQDAVIALENAWKHIGLTYTLPQKKFVGVLSDILLLLMIELKQIFDSHQEYDFIEVSLRALEAMGSEDSPTDLALKLDYQIKHLLIDEFQDTSVTQWRLLQKIMAGWENNDGRTLFVVGDPMQSIYRFRKAHVGLFLEVQQHGINQIKPSTLTLTSNFRSNKALVAWYNKSFFSIFPKKSEFNLGAISYTPCESVTMNEYHSEENIQEAVFYHPIQLTNFSHPEIAEATKILDVISSLHHSEKIAILARSRNHFKAIIPLLEKNNIAYCAHELDSFDDHPLIEDLFSLTRALLHPADKIAWLAILRAPWCGCDLNTLSMLCENKDDLIWECLINTPHTVNSRFQHFIYTLKNSIQHQGKYSLREWIENTWLNLKGPNCLSIEQYTNDIQVSEYFFDTLDEVQHLHYSELIQGLEKKLSAKKNRSNATPSQPVKVELMTIHKAKGLEFDHVILPGLEKYTRSDASKLFLWEERLHSDSSLDLLVAPIPLKNTQDKMYDYLKQADSKKNEHELARLLYVAATRAKKSLHLLFSTHIKSPPKNSFLYFLQPLLPEQIIFHSKAHKKERSTIMNSLQRIPEKYFSELSCSQYSDSNPAENLPLLSLLNDDEFRAIGTVVHEALNLLSQQLKVSQAYLKLQLIHLTGTLDKFEMITRCLENIQEDPTAQWILASHTDAKSEFALSTSHQRIIIDRTFVDENNVRWIIDYKITSHVSKELYQSQLETYAKILSQMEKRSIKLGLYFPLTKDWIHWAFK